MTELHVLPTPDVMRGVEALQVQKVAIGVAELPPPTDGKLALSKDTVCAISADTAAWQLADPYPGRDATHKLDERRQIQALSTRINSLTDTDAAGKRKFTIDRGDIGALPGLVQKRLKELGLAGIMINATGSGNDSSAIATALILDHIHKAPLGTPSKQLLQDAIRRANEGLIAYNDARGGKNTNWNDDKASIAVMLTSSDGEVNFFCTEGKEIAIVDETGKAEHFDKDLTVQSKLGTVKSPVPVVRSSKDPMKGKVVIGGRGLKAKLEKLPPATRKGDVQDVVTALKTKEAATSSEDKEHVLYAPKVRVIPDTHGLDPAFYGVDANSENVVSVGDVIDTAKNLYPLDKNRYITTEIRKLINQDFYKGKDSPSFFQKTDPQYREFMSELLGAVVAGEANPIELNAKLQEVLKKRLITGTTDEDRERLDKIDRLNFTEFVNVQAQEYINSGKERQYQAAQQIDIRKAIDVWTELLKTGKGNLVLGNHEMLAMAGFIGNNDSMKAWLDGQNNGIDTLRACGIKVDDLLDVNAEISPDKFAEVRNRINSNEPLRNFISLLFKKGKMYMIANEALIVHAGIPVGPDGSLIPPQKRGDVTWPGFEGRIGLDALDDIEKALRKVGEALTTGDTTGIEIDVKIVELLGTGKQDTMSPGWMREPFFKVMADNKASSKALAELSVQARVRGADIKAIMIGHTETQGGKRVGNFVFGTDTAVGDVVTLEQKKDNMVAISARHKFGTKGDIHYPADTRKGGKTMSVAASEIKSKGAPKTEPAAPSTAPERTPAPTPRPDVAPAPPAPAPTERIEDVTNHKIPMYVDNKEKPINARKFMKQAREARGVSASSLANAGIDRDAPPTYIQVSPDGGTYDVIVTSVYEAHKDWAGKVIAEATKQGIADVAIKSGESEGAHKARVYRLLKDRLKWQGDYLDDPLRKVIDTVHDPMHTLLGNVTPSQIMSLEVMALEALAPPPKLIENPAIKGLRATMQAEPTLDVRSEVEHQAGYAREEGDWMSLFEAKGKKNPEVMKDVLAADLMIEAAGKVKIDTVNRAILDATLAGTGFSVEDGDTYQTLLDRIGEKTKDVSEDNPNGTEQKSADRLKARKGMTRAKLYLYERIKAVIGPEGTRTTKPVGYENIASNLLAVSGNLDAARAGFTRKRTGEAKTLLGELRATDLNDRALKGMDMYLRLIKDPSYLEPFIMYEEPLGEIYEQQFIQSEAAALKYIVDNPPVTPTPTPRPTPAPAPSAPVPTEPLTTPEPPVSPDVVEPVEPEQNNEDITVAPPVPEARPDDPADPELPPPPEPPTEPPRPPEPPAPRPTPPPVPPPTPPRPQPALRALNIAIVSSPKHYVKQTEELTDHSFALDLDKDMTPRNAIQEVSHLVLHPIQSFKRMWQKQLMNNVFKHQHSRFVTDVVTLVHRKLGVNETVPVDVQISLLDQAIAGGKALRKTKNPIHRFFLNLTDAATGLTGIGQSADMHMAREWLNNRNADFFKNNVLNNSIDEQAELAEKFAASSSELSFEEENQLILSREMGEERFMLEDVIPDESVRDEVEGRVRELIRQYATGQITTREALLNRINTYMLATLQNDSNVDRKIRDQLDILEIASNITKVADEVKTHWADQYEADFDEMEMNIYFGKGEWGGARGETGAGWYERACQRRIKQRRITRSVDATIGSNVRFLINIRDAVKDAAGFTAAYLGGGLVGSYLQVPGRMVAPVVKWMTLNPLVASLAVGVTSAGVEGGVYIERNGFIRGFKGRYLRDFVQVSREAAFGRTSGANATRRKDFENVFVDWKAANDLTNNINVLVERSRQGQELNESELKQLTIRVAEAKARLRMTDVTATHAAKIAQNFVRYSEGKENEELSALRMAILEGVNAVARTSDTAFPDLLKAQAVMEAQLRVGTDRESIIRYTASQLREITRTDLDRRGLRIDTEAAEELVNEYMDGVGALNIGTGKSLHEAMSCLSKLNTRHAATSGIKSAAASFILPTVGRWAALEAGAIGNSILDAAQGKAPTFEYLRAWTQINFNVIPVKLDAQGNPQAQLTGMQRAYLGMRDFFRKIGPQEATPNSLYKDYPIPLISGGQHTIQLPPEIQLHDIKDANGAIHRYIVDARTAELVDLTNTNFDLQDINNDGKPDLVIVDKAGKVTPFTELFGGGVESNGSNGFYERPPGHGQLKVSTVATNLNGHTVTTHIPSNTEWHADPQSPNTWDLKDTKGTLLIDNARFDTTGNLLKQADYHEAPELAGKIMEGLQIVNSTETFTNAGGEFDTRLTSPVEKREWYAYDTRGSEENELRLETFKQDNTLTLTMNGMTDTLSRQTGLNPEAIDVDAVFGDQNERAGFYVSLPGHPNEGIFLPADEHGNFKFDLNNKTDYVSFPDGTKMTVADFTKMMINQQAFTGAVENGNIATELTGRQWIFNIGNANGDFGYISAGRLINENGKEVFQSFATIRGCTELPESFETTTGEAQVTIDINSVDGDARYDFETNPMELPKAYALPIYWREQVERSRGGRAAATPRRRNNQLNPNQQPAPNPNPQLTVPQGVSADGTAFDYEFVDDPAFLTQIGVNLQDIGQRAPRDVEELRQSILHLEGHLNDGAPETEIQPWRNRLAVVLNRHYNPAQVRQIRANIEASIAAKQARPPARRITPPEEPERQLPQAMPLVSRFNLVEGEPDQSKNPYFVQNVPQTIRIEQSDLSSYVKIAPFFRNIQVQGRNFSLKTNPAVVPYVFKMGSTTDPQAQDLRFLDAEDTTKGDSGLFALAAASAPDVESQARLYKHFANVIFSVHDNDNQFLNDWLNAQMVLEPGATLSSASIFAIYDSARDEDGSHPEQRLVTAYDSTKPEEQRVRFLSGPELTTLWQQRITQLKTALRNNAIESHHLRWIEFLSHSIDKEKMIDLIKRQAPTVPPAPVNRPAATGTAEAGVVAGNRNVMEQRRRLEAFHPQYARIYDRLISDQPELASMHIEFGTKDDNANLEFTGGVWLPPTNTDPRSGIMLNSENPSTLGERLLRHRPESARMAAESLEIPLTELSSNPELLTTFIFLHEVGHVRYLQTKFKTSLVPMTAYKHERDTEMSRLPVPSRNPVQVKQLYDQGKLTSYYEQNKTTYERMNIHSPEDLVRQHEKAYRNLQSEKYSDEFAAGFMRSHAAEFGWQIGGRAAPAPEQPPATRVESRLSAESINFSRQNRIILPEHVRLPFYQEDKLDANGITSHSLPMRIGRDLLNVSTATSNGGVRSRDEDTMLIAEGSDGHLTEWRLAGVFDGMGGHKNGDNASFYAAKRTEQIITDYMEGRLQPLHINRDRLNAGDEVEVQKLFDYVAGFLQNEAGGIDEVRGGGTTASIVFSIGQKLFAANIGDSRIYKQTSQGLSQLTDDDSDVYMMWKDGSINSTTAKQHQYRSAISKELLKQGARFTVQRLDPLQPGEAYMLTCDGVPEAVDQEYTDNPTVLQAMLKTARKQSNAAKNLIERILAKNNGKTQDNISCIVIQR